jgi:hypothetical protein
MGYRIAEAARSQNDHRGPPAGARVNTGSWGSDWDAGGGNPGVVIPVAWLAVGVTGDVDEFVGGMGDTV